MKFKQLSNLAVFAIIFSIASTQVQAGMLRDKLKERLQQRNEDGSGDLSELGGAGSSMSCEDWAKKVNSSTKQNNDKNSGPTPDLKDVAYGSGNLEKLDVFLPKKSANNDLAPMMLMVHGGGWCVGDKGGAVMTQNKVARWVPKGFVFISINYPMINDGKNALAQANYVAKAAAFVQANAQKWGGNSTKLILMGHSAGAHLVSLVNADAQIRQANSLHPILGTVSLDAGAVDVVKQMPNVYPFLKARYTEAFGTTEAEWITASPFQKLAKTAAPYAAAPWLGVCSTKRKDNPCAQATAYAEKSNGLGIKSAVLPESKSHKAINEELGLSGSYTSGVEAFMASLDPTVAKRLSH